MQDKNEMPQGQQMHKEGEELLMSLYENIHKKRARIKAGSGEKMRNAGAKGAPTAANFRKAAKTAKKPTKTTRT